MSTNPAPDKDSVQFGRVPYEMIARGLTKDMTRGAARVYLAIAAHANDDWICWLSLPRLEELTGLSRPGVISSIECLEDVGAVHITRGVGRGNASQYRIQTKSKAHLTLSQANELSPLNPLDGPMGQISEAKQSSSIGKTVKNRDLKSKARLTPTEKNSIEQQQQTGAAHAAAADNDESGSEIADALRAAGIGNPARDRLSRTAGVTAELVCREATRLNGTGKGVPILIENIETGAAKSIADEDRRSREQDDTAQKRRATGEKLARIAAANAAAKELIDTLPDDRVAELHLQVLDGCQPLKREVWERANPRANLDLMREIARVARTGAAELDGSPQDPAEQGDGARTRNAGAES